MKSLAAIGADVAIARKQFAIRQARSKFKGIDAMNSSGANDAIDFDDRLLARDGIVATMKNGNFLTRFPAYILG